MVQIQKTGKFGHMFLTMLIDHDLITIRIF